MRAVLPCPQPRRDGGKRVVLALEHENWYSGIEKELENLSTVDAPLKVLVTYVRDREHVWRPFKLAEQVKRHLAECFQRLQ